MALALQIEKVLVLDGVDASCTQLLESNGIKVDIRAKLSEEELVTSLGGYDAVVVRSATKVKGDVLHAGASGRLKLISRAGTGVDNIDVDAATRRGVLVMNAPGGNTFSAAEHACGLMLAVARNVAAADSSMKAGQWDRKKFAGCELDGKVLGVLGVGRIGQAVATRMQAFGMRTVGYDPVVPPSLMRENGVEPVDLEELWKVSDFITVHTPLLPSTKGMLGAEVIGKCKQGVRIINAARGGIVDEEALVSALESGHCGGAGLDVFEEEPPKNRKLIEHPRVTACPHLGASTPEAQKRCGQEIGEQIVSLVKGISAAGIINCPAVSSLFVPGVRPYLSLSMALGRLSAGIAGVNKDFVLSVSVLSMKQHKSCLGIGLTVGLFKQLGNDVGVSLVNAANLAKDRGIKVDVECLENKNSGLLSVTTGSKACVSGVVSGERAVITEVEGFSLELPVKGHIFVVKGKKTNLSPQEILQKLPVTEQATILLSTVGDHWLCIFQTAEKLPLELATAVSVLNGVVSSFQVDFASE